MNGEIVNAEPINLAINTAAIDTVDEPVHDRVYVKSHAKLPERQPFEYAEFHAQSAERTGYSEYSYWKSVLHEFVQQKSAVVMLIIFALLFIFTFVATAISKFDVHHLRIVDSLMFTAPNNEFWFGTDNMGRDYWSQVWYATRTSILLAVSVSVGQILLGVIIGLVWGYVRKLDRFITEVYNLIDNIPTIIYMTLIALMIGKSYLIIGLGIVAFGWLATARNVRNLVFMYRDREYNLASRCLGTSLWRILTKNILPYLISVVILRLALAIPATIAYETTLAYLGLMDISTPSLGILLRNARSFFLDYPYLLIIPAAIVSVITVTFYLVGNALSDACDPRNHV
ncbi:peptide ABC transporter permease [Clostridia bacterium]|nr:peptide ABC transporter permease [Clostridia bacterium]